MTFTSKATGLSGLSEKSSSIAEYALGLRNWNSRSFSFLAFATTLIVFTDFIGTYPLTPLFAPLIVGYACACEEGGMARGFARGWCERFSGFMA